MNARSRRGALPDRAHAEQSTAKRADDAGRLPRMRRTEVAVQPAVDGTSPWALQPVDLTPAASGL
jgi:hypothetical protein